MGASDDIILTPKQEQYLEWLCTLASEREPKTKSDMARVLEVNRRTLTEWEHKGIFRDKWKVEIEAVQGSPERTQTMLDSLYERGVAGDVKSAQLFLQATGRLGPTAPVVATEKRASELTDAELDALIPRVAQALMSERVAAKAPVLRIVP